MSADPSELDMAVVGPRTWNRWEAEAASLPCRTCAEEGVMLIRGNHDVVNVNQLNKPIYDPDNFIRYKKAVDSAYQKGFTGRNALYTGSEQEPPQRKMAPSGLVPAYVGNILAYGLEVGIDMVPATAIPIPGIGPKSLLNTIAAVGFLALGWKTHRSRTSIHGSPSSHRGTSRSGPMARKRCVPQLCGRPGR